MNNFQKRSQTLQDFLNQNNSILLSSESEIKYFTNFIFLVADEREAFVLITKNSINIIHTSFAPLSKISGYNYFPGSFPNQLSGYLQEIIKKDQIELVYIDKNSLFVSELEAIKLSNKNITIKDLNELEKNPVTELRTIKDEAEIGKITKACQITSEVMKEITERLVIGTTEKQLEKTIKNLYAERGIDELAFPTIVAFGENSALPHHQPGDKVLENNMPVLIDMGAKFADYCADMTRTFWFGANPSKQFEKVEKIVKTAYSLAVDSLSKSSLATGSLATGSSTAGSQESQNLLAKDIDNAARVYISNQGYAEQFNHTTGHGLGLSIHEQPSLSWRNNQKILPGMTITIEPGIYLENLFGYRYENTVLVEKNGFKELTFA